MFDLTSFGYSFLVLTLFGIALWIGSRIKNDVGIVDSFWSLFIFAAALSFYLFGNVTLTERSQLILLLLFIWAIRLAAHITWRNWGQEEDLRYQSIRANNQPNFEFKSLYIVFLLQAWLAVIVALPIMSALNIDIAEQKFSLLDYIAITLWFVGMIFESVGDMQLALFKADEKNKGKVMREGLWRFTRHPNYFGEFCIWWGFFLFAVSSGYWWSIISPILVTILLLKVSGVSMLESTITERRPQYADYCKTTNAFFPWLPKKFTH